MLFSGTFVRDMKLELSLIYIVSKLSRYFMQQRKLTLTGAYTAKTDVSVYCLFK